MPEPEVPKLAQTLARRIESDILSERLPVGHRLGTEPELQRRYGVSRAVLREAIRLVERHQLGETRRGPAGGLFVRQPAREAVANLLSLYLEAAGVESAELFEARRLVESSTAYYAAKRGRAADRKALRALASDRLHSAIAELAQSPALELFAHTLLLLGPVPARSADAWRSEERAIAKQIAEGQGVDARRRMQQYLLAREAAPARSRPRRAAAQRSGPDKRAELLARELRDAIRGARLTPGTRIGSEAELLRLHGVSRAIFREAVRMLEQHSLVRMRRGLGGGLFVAEPDPGAIVLSASVYLAHLELSPKSYHEARRALEPAAAALAAERASADGLRRLQVALGRALVAGESDLAPAARDLHALIADLCGNRAVALFARTVITTAWGDERFAPPPPSLPRGWQDDLRNSQMRIALAIQERDAILARAAMEEHLAITTAWWTGIRKQEEWA